jgi:uncharacterized damage-inducible protein DinB
MTEPLRLKSLFQKLYNGEPWIDVNIVGALQGITAGGAAKRLLQNSNSIWEITNHLISWRLNVLERVNGKIITTPDDNYFEIITDHSEKAWAETLHRLQNTQQQWLAFLNKSDTAGFEKLYPANSMTYYEHIQGIIQHDAYHLGQIVLLKKLL